MPDARRSVTGGTEGNNNALKHGRYTADAIARRRYISMLDLSFQEVVHSVLRESHDVWQHQRSRSGPNGQPPESSELERDDFSSNAISLYVIGGA